MSETSLNRENEPSIAIHDKRVAECPVIMFDLGGVLYDINLQRTRDSFSLLAGRTVDFSLTSQHEVFDRFECGKATPAEFRVALRQAYSMEATDEDLDAAWNALLVGLDQRSVHWLREVSKRHRIILLSNINVLHHHRIADECRDLFDCFEHLFLSYEMGQRKPWPQIYSMVLDSMKLQAEEVFYLDDSPQHIATAESMGFVCHRVHAIDDVPRILGIDSSAT